MGSVQEYKSIIEFRVEEIAYFLSKCLGNVSLTAETMGVKSSVLRDKIARTPELQAIRNELVEEVIDKAESNLFSSVESGDEKATKFVLSTLGKNRGYTTKTESEVSVVNADEKARLLIEARKRAGINQEPENDK